LSDSTIHNIEVSAEQALERLDKWLASLDFIPSRSRAAELIERGFVTLNGKAVKASQKVAAGQVIRVEIPQAASSELEALDQPLEVLHEDNDVIVVNKPAGLVVHPAAGHAQDTLVNILLHHASELSMGFNEQRPGIVHRLDRDTSGILVVAKNDPAHHHLAAQFREKAAHRIYWALSHDQPRTREGTIRTLLARHPNDRKRFASSQNGLGKMSVTHYKVLQSNSKYSWIQCKLETGRTHQIRVHLSEQGIPILGDPIYGSKQRDKKLGFISRMALHACELGFEHPRTREKLFFKVPWPTELKTILREIGFKDV